MKYFVGIFKIQAQPGEMQTARELLADDLAEVGFESFEDTTDGLTAYVQEQLFDQKAVADKCDHFLMPGVKISFSVDKAEDKDWNETWEKSGFAPIVIKNALCIVDANSPGNDVPSLPAGSPVIKIQARQAFGTGTHQTTRMICSVLLMMNLKGKRVVDCGCGTGILGIVASKLGASEVVGYDIDEWSVENAQHNARLNGVDNMQIFHGDANVLSHVSGMFDVVLANINRNVLLADMHAFNDVLHSGSTLVLSGFYADDIPMIEQSTAALGYEEVNRISEDNWACLQLQKK